MQWQFHPSLGLSYNKLYDEDYDIYLCFLVIGCFQFNWYSSK
jgi:hypothetical protein